MKSKDIKIVSIFLILSLATLSGNLFVKERKHGTEFEILKINGQQIRGELIAVKQNSILLLASSVDVSTDIEDIKVIRVIKDSKLLVGGGLGLLIGGGVGALIGFLFGSDEPIDSDDPDDISRTASQKALTTGIIFGLIGAIGGSIAGADAGTDEIILIEGRPPDEIKEILEKLKSQARYPDYK